MWSNPPASLYDVKVHILFDCMHLWVDIYGILSQGRGIIKPFAHLPKDNIQLIFHTYSGKIWRIMSVPPGIIFYIQLQQMVRNKNTNNLQPFFVVEFHSWQHYRMRKEWSFSCLFLMSNTEKSADIIHIFKKYQMMLHSHVTWGLK